MRSRAWRLCSRGEKRRRGITAPHRRGVRSVEPDGPGDGLQVLSGLAPREASGQDALVEQMQRMLLAVTDGAHDLMRPARHAQAGLAAPDTEETLLHKAEQAFARFAAITPFWKA